MLTFLSRETELHAELERNVWFLCEADDVAALTMLQPPSKPHESWQRSLEIGPPTEIRHDEGWLRDTMWSGVLAQLGGEYRELARFPGDHELVWRHMEALWEAQSQELHRRIDEIGERGAGA